MQQIKSLGVMSVAKVAGLCYGAMGLCFAPIFLLISTVASVAARHAGTPGFPPFFGVVFAVCAPFLYGAMGFVMGALGALVYNLIAGWIGGIELDLQTVVPQGMPLAREP